MRYVLLSFMMILLTLWSSHSSAGQSVDISVVFTSDVAAYREAWVGFERGLQTAKLSANISEFTLTDGKTDEISSAMGKKRSDIAVTFGTKASKLAAEKISRTPLIFCMVLDPSEVSNTNSTGVSMQIPLGTKLQAIRKVLPKARRIGLVYSSDTEGQYAELLRGCSEMGFMLIARRIGTEQEFAGALKEITKKIDCFLMIADSQIYSSASVKLVLLESLRNRIPVLGLSSRYTKAGALFSIDSDYADLGRQAAEIAVRVLQGESPEDIPPVGPRKTNLSLNLAVAQRLGIKLSSSVLEEAVEVFGQ